MRDDPAYTIRQREQRQDSLTEQLKTVHIAAARLGCYDAADWLWRQAPLHRTEPRIGRPDRTVHARCDVAEVVRYEKAGKWYIEPLRADISNGRVTVARAAQYAVWGVRNAHGFIHWDLPGGRTFDRLVRHTTV